MAAVTRGDTAGQLGYPQMRQRCRRLGNTSVYAYHGRRIRRLRRTSQPGRRRQPSRREAGSKCREPLASTGIEQEAPTSVQGNSGASGKESLGASKWPQGISEPLARVGLGLRPEAARNPLHPRGGPAGRRRPAGLRAAGHTGNAMAAGGSIQGSSPLGRNAPRDRQSQGFPSRCQGTSGLGSGAIVVIGSVGEQDAFAEQVGFGASVHLSFDHFKSYVAFDGA